MSPNLLVGFSLSWLERLGLVGTYQEESWCVPLGASAVLLLRSLCTQLALWSVFGSVFLHCYFGMYLLEGISTLDAPQLPLDAVYSVYLSLFLNALYGALSSVFIR